MKKKDFDRGVLLLPLGYLVFAAMLFIGFMPDKQQNYPTGKAVRAAFDECYEEMDQVSRLLWEHPEYFADLYASTKTTCLQRSTMAKGKGNEAGYLTEAEWNRLSALCEIIQPDEIAMRSYGGTNAIQWVFFIKEPIIGSCSLNLYYIPSGDAPATDADQAAFENAISHFGRYGALSLMEGKDFWYEATIMSGSGSGKSVKTN